MELVNLKPEYSNLSADQCEKSGINSGNKQVCCNWNQYWFASYNPNESCCGDQGVKSIGSC